MGLVKLNRPCYEVYHQCRNNDYLILILLERWFRRQSSGQKIICNVSVWNERHVYILYHNKHPERRPDKDKDFVRKWRNKTVHSVSRGSTKLYLIWYSISNTTSQFTTQGKSSWQRLVEMCKIILFVCRIKTGRSNLVWSNGPNTRVLARYFIGDAELNVVPATECKVYM